MLVKFSWCFAYIASNTSFSLMLVYKCCCGCLIFNMRLDEEHNSDEDSVSRVNTKVFYRCCTVLRSCIILYNLLQLQQEPELSQTNTGNDCIRLCFLWHSASSVTCNSFFGFTTKNPKSGIPVFGIRLREEGKKYRYFGWHDEPHYKLTQCKVCWG